MKTFFTVGEMALTDAMFFLISGPCVIEEESLTIEIATELKAICRELEIPFIFKASFDKANRSSINSFRGPGLQAGLAILQAVREKVGVPVLSDIHETVQAEAVKEVLDIIQIPAFLSRQTDLLIAAARTGLPVNVKKSQFMAPEEMSLVVKKLEESGNRRILLTERGTFFGYQNLVVDFRNIPIMKRTAYPVVIDAGHSVQRPAAAGSISGGNPEFIPMIAAAGIVAGANGVFLETHPEPEKARSDPHSSLPLKNMKTLLNRLKKVYNTA